MTRVKILFVVALVLVAAVSAHGSRITRLRKATSQDPGSQGAKTTTKVPSLDLSGVKAESQGLNTHRSQIPRLPLGRVQQQQGGEGPKDYMPEMAIKSKEGYDRYFADFNEQLNVAKNQGHPFVANNFPEFTVAGMKVNLVFYSAATGFESNSDLVKYDQAFAQAAMEFLKTNFLRLHTKAIPEVYAKVKTLKVLAAPVAISSVATVFAAPGQGERASEYQSVIFLGRLAYSKIEGCNEVLRGKLVADQYSAAIKNPAARPFAFFLHEFAHVVMMTTQSEQFTKMAKTCVDQASFALADLPKMAEAMYTFFKELKAEPAGSFNTPAPFYGTFYLMKVQAEISNYAQAKNGVCGYLEFIPEVWSGALLGMPATSSKWEETLFKLLVPGMPLNREPALPGWCPAFGVGLIAPPKPKSK